MTFLRITQTPGEVKTVTECPCQTPVQLEAAREDLKRSAQ